MSTNKTNPDWNGAESMANDAAVLADIYADLDSDDNDVRMAASDEEAQLPVSINAVTLLDVVLSVNGVRTGLKVELENDFGRIVSVTYYAKYLGFDDYEESVDEGSDFWRLAERAVDVHNAGNGEFA